MFVGSLVVWQLTHLILLHATGALQLDFSVDSLRTVFFGLLGFAAPVVGLSFALAHRPRARVTALGVWLFLQTLLSMYLFAAKGSLDYAMVIDNAPEAFTPQSAGLIGEVAFAPISIILGLVCAAFIALWWRFDREPRTPDYRVSAGAAVVFVALISWPHGTTDELTAFFGGAVRYHVGNDRFADEYPPGTYPLIVETGPLQAPAQPPHVFVIMIESFNARVVGAQTAEGQPITPVFNRLAKSSVTIERFYANSIQTSKGHFALMFSVLPRVRGKALRKANDTRYRGLPRVMAQAGYHTRYVQAFHDIGFDNTEFAMGHAGFEDVRTIHSRLKPEDKDHTWGWGPEDHVLHRRTFELLDEARDAGDDRPVFVALATIQNHMRFKVPAHLRPLHAEPESHRERYENSIHLSDASLQTFFDELAARPWLAENSVVIVTGDHSFPLGEHGMEHNELGYWDESFRTPMLIWTNGRLPAHRDTERVGSQIDLAPTLLELTGVKPGDHHFMGRSLLAPADPEHAACLVQPYNGTWLGVVKGRYKYLQRERTSEERVYDLIADPGERHNVKDSLSDSELDALRKHAEMPYRTQYLMDHDQIWDGRSVERKDP